LNRNKPRFLIFGSIFSTWILLSILFPFSCPAQTGYLFSTVAGGGVPDMVPSALNASLNLPARQVMAIDASGNLYFASSNAIFKKSVNSGVITRIAGATSALGFSGNGGPALLAVFNQPGALAVDLSGNVYVADQNNNQVRMIGVDGNITNVAGIGVPGFFGDGGLATNAALYGPTGLAIAPDGSLIISDTVNYRIRRVAPTGIITTIAGSGFGGFSGDGGLATAAGLYFPSGIAADGAGNIYVADSDNQRVRKIAPNGIITTVAGTGVAGFSGDGGPAVNAQLNGPLAVAVSPAGDIYISDDNSRIRQVDSGGTISTFAGDGIDGFSGDGGLALGAQVSLPSAMAFDSSGSLYFVDAFNSRVRVISPNGIINTIIGNGTVGYSGDGGSALAAQIVQPASVALGPDGSLYIPSPSNQAVRKVSTSGFVSTLAGTGISGFSGDSGPAALAALNQPNSVAVDSHGNAFISDSQNFRIRRVDAVSGVISTIAGNGSFIESGDGLAAVSAGLSPPRAIALDTAGNLYISGDSGRVRKVGTNGIITTVAGNGILGYSGDGGLATSAEINAVAGVVADFANGFYIFDSINYRVRHSTPPTMRAGPTPTAAGCSRAAPERPLPKDSQLAARNPSAPPMPTHPTTSRPRPDSPACFAIATPSPAPRPPSALRSRQLTTFPVQGAGSTPRARHRADADRAAMGWLVGHGWSPRRQDSLGLGFGMLRMSLPLVLSVDRVCGRTSREVDRAILVRNHTGVMT
jgi:trimeric autotransporter adhesin